MLKQRLLTAIILIPLFIFAVLKLSAIHFYYLTCGLLIWGACEWNGFLKIKTLKYQCIYPIIVISLFFIAYYYLPLIAVLYAACAGWAIAAWLVISYPNYQPKGIVLRGMMGLGVLIPCGLAINFIRQLPHGIHLLLFLFVLIWGADTGAYFAGKKWGKHKLLEQVSPGKTWEGLIGALITTAIITLIGLFTFKIPYMHWMTVFILCWVTVLFSVLGDLFESLLKRTAGLKDSGSLLPGHGGILDRIDSLTAAAPVFLLGVLILLSHNIK